MKSEIMRYSGRRARIGPGFLLLASWVSGCGADAAVDPAVNNDESLGVTQSALPASLGTWSDWSGTVNVAAWQCDWVGPSSRPVASCAVPDPTYVLIGGGAEITTTGSAGALLTKSYPVEAHAADLSTWRAESKDHVYSNPHHLRAFAIGLKLTGLTAAQLRTQMIVAVTTSNNPASAPTASAYLPSGYLIASVGAYTNYAGAGQLLTEVVGSLSGGFSARSKDHLVADPSSITASAIGVARCPAGYVGGCLEGTYALAANNNPVTGYMTKSFTWSGFAMTGVGGMAWNQANAGRMFVTMRVWNQTVEVWSKDHGVAAANNLVAQWMGLQKKP